ncbi:MAG TPA: hypothetical protein VKN99_20235 [Polyangia bacterium]|nr:hypothetical protein [Polyangia bacterium]
MSRVRASPLAALVAVLAPGGCTHLGSYGCTQSASCLFHSTAGFCESNGWCSFPDGAGQGQFFSATR